MEKKRVWIEWRRAKSKEDKERKRKGGEKKTSQYLLPRCFVRFDLRGLRGCCILGLCRHDDSFQMLVGITASRLQEIHISGSQWAGGVKVHLEEVLDETNFEVQSDPELDLNLL